MRNNFKHRIIFNYKDDLWIVQDKIHRILPLKLKKRANPCVGPFFMRKAAVFSCDEAMLRVMNWQACDAAYLFLPEFFQKFL